MELRDYLKILKKRIWLFITILAVVMLAVYVFTITRPDKFSGSITFYTLSTLEVEQLSDSDFYQYNNYYVFKASESFLDTVIAWIKDPANVVEIYERADEILPETNLKKYSSLIKTRKMIPAAVQITLSSNDEEYVKNLLNSTRSVLIDKVKQWNDKGILKNASIDVSEPFVVREKPSLIVNLGIAIIISIILGLALVYFTEYMEGDKSEK